MKSITIKMLSLLSVFAWYCQTAAATSEYDETQIVILYINPTTRSIVDMPDAFVQHDVLSISFDASGMYSLYVEDSFGAIVFTSTLPANGMEYDYDLSGIGEGLFRLVLEGPSAEYEGHFTIL